MLRGQARNRLFGDPFERHQLRGAAGGGALDDFAAIEHMQQAGALVLKHGVDEIEIGTHADLCQFGEQPAAAIIFAAEPVRLRQMEFAAAREQQDVAVLFEDAADHYLPVGGQPLDRPPLHAESDIAAAVIAERYPWRVREIDHAPDQDDMVAGFDLLVHLAVQPRRTDRQQRAAGLRRRPLQAGELVGFG